jgi:hypothetical protein
MLFMMIGAFAARTAGAATPVPLEDGLNWVSLVTSENKDVVVVVGQITDALQPRHYFFFSQYKRDEKGKVEYNPIAIDPDLSKVEMSIGAQNGDNSTEQYISEFRDVDCYLHRPMIFPANDKRKNTVVVVMSNNYINKTNDNKLDPPPTKLIKMVVVPRSSAISNYMLKIEKVMQLKDSYCLPTDVPDEIGALVDNIN